MYYKTVQKIEESMSRDEVRKCHGRIKIMPSKNEKES